MYITTLSKIIGLVIAVVVAMLVTGSALPLLGLVMLHKDFIVEPPLIVDQTAFSPEAIGETYDDEEFVGNPIGFVWDD